MKNEKNKNNPYHCFLVQIPAIKYYTNSVLFKLILISDLWLLQALNRVAGVDKTCDFVKVSEIGDQAYICLWFLSF